jgi:hypothetical protein
MLRKFYLGSLTDLQELEEPDSFTRPAERIQSISQGASGRRTTNVTGIKRKWELSWSDALPETRERLEQLYYGFGANEPLRFFDPYTTNLLHPRDAAAGSSYGYGNTFSLSNIVETHAAPTGSGLAISPTPRLVTVLTNPSSTFPNASFLDFRGRQLPATLGDVTLSAWVLATNGGTMTLLPFNSEVGFTSGTPQSVTISASSTWQHVSLTASFITGFPVWRVKFNVPVSSAIQVGPMKAELGDTASDWTSGTGARVVIESLNDEVRLYPYSGLSLTLLEV